MPESINKNFPRKSTYLRNCSKEFTVRQRMKKGTAAANMTSIRKDKPRSQQLLSDRSRVQLVYVDSIDGKNSAVMQKKAKSHAAKESHARLRRERMAQFEKFKHRIAVQAIEPTVHFRREQLATVVVQESSQPISSSSPMGLLSAAPTDPFASAARPISMSEYYLIHHYVDMVVPAGHSDSLAFPNADAYLHTIKTEWIPLAFSDPGLLNGILVSACRSLHSLQENCLYLETALQYKLSCIRSLNRDISTDRAVPRDSTIAKAILLAADEVAIGDLPAGKRHVNAAQQMVALRGGLAALETNKYLSTVMESFMSDERIKSQAIMLFTNYSHFRTHDL